jgi:molybdate transport system ATP-binding protein
MRLASDIAVLADGRLSAFGSAGEIAQRLDLIPAEEREEGGAIIDMAVAAHDRTFGMTKLSSPAGDIHVPGILGPAGTPARLRIRARDVMLATEEPRNISALNILRGTVSMIAEAGPSAVNVTLDCGGSPVVARITRQSAAALGIRPGLQAFAVVKAVSVSGPTTEPR